MQETEENKNDALGGVSTLSHIRTVFIRFIPQGSVDNNLKPDPLAGPNAPDAQTTNPLKSQQSVHGNKFSLFLGQGISTILILSFWLI